jgi:hypothetical protein
MILNVLWMDLQLVKPIAIIIVKMLLSIFPCPIYQKFPKDAKHLPSWLKLTCQFPKILLKTLPLEFPKLWMLLQVPVSKKSTQ